MVGLVMMVVVAADSSAQLPTQRHAPAVTVTDQLLPTNSKWLPA